MRTFLLAASVLLVSQLPDAAMAQSAIRLAQMRLPPGSYQYTCRACRFDGRYLSCSCRTSQGAWRRSGLDWGGSGACSVGNRESQLYCE
jgi:hypothetical protein